MKDVQQKEMRLGLGQVTCLYKPEFLKKGERKESLAQPP